MGLKPRNGSEAIDLFGELSGKMSYEGLTNSSLFGKSCIKIAGKSCVALFHDSVVFKLSGDSHMMALGLSGAVLWDPSGKGRPMREWVSVPHCHAAHWLALANAAASYVSRN